MTAAIVVHTARRIATLRELLCGLALAAAVLVTGLTAAAPVRADPDTDFANQLHTYGIYGPRDYNAWLAKITCKRLESGLDHNAFDSAKFLSRNLAHETTTEQSWQFLSATVTDYCPDQQPVLIAAASAS